MSALSRRALLQASAGAAALAAVPISALSTSRAGAASGTTAPGAASSVGTGSPGPVGPVMFCVHDASRGEVAVLHGADEVIVRDRQLVARIMQAASRRPL